MLSKGFMVDFVNRADLGEVDAAEFVDNCNETLEAFKLLIELGNLKKAYDAAVNSDYDCVPDLSDELFNKSQYDEQELAELEDVQEYANLEDISIIWRIMELI